MLIKNVLVLGFLIISYYITLLAISWMWDTINTDIGILGNVQDAMPEEVLFLWNIIIYFLFPMFFAIAFIVKTKPQQQVGYYAY